MYIALVSLVVSAALVSGCDGRPLPAGQDADGGADPLAFCHGPPSVTLDREPALLAESAEAHWTIVSGPAGPRGGLAVQTRVWVRLARRSTWDWYNDSGITVDEQLAAPVQIDLALLPSAAWLAWSEHGLTRTLPDADKPFSTKRGHRFQGWFRLRGSPDTGGEASICLLATRPDGSAIGVHAANVRLFAW